MSDLVILVDGVEWDRREVERGTDATHDFACDLCREAWEWNPDAEVSWHVEEVEA